MVGSAAYRAEYQMLVRMVCSSQHVVVYCVVLIEQGVVVGIVVVAGEHHLAEHYSPLRWCCASQL